MKIKVRTIAKNWKITFTTTRKNYAFAYQFQKRIEKKKIIYLQTIILKKIFCFKKLKMNESRINKIKNKIKNEMKWKTSFK